MKIKEFKDSFVEKINEILEKGIIVSSGKEESYSKGDWTFVFNCAVYEVVKDADDCCLCAEPDALKTPVGRGGYSDMLICSDDKKRKDIVIEHEQDSSDDSLKDNIRKLANHKGVRNKLLITYYDPDDNQTEKGVLEVCFRFKKKYFNPSESLFVLIAPGRFDDAKKAFNLKELK